ncbi:MAG: ATP-binding protein [Endomicrobium sp.]|nr:ATP-binding protein [Endomicrobium sp.]
MEYKELIEKAVLKIGNVVEINGKKVFIVVDKNKNSPDLLFNGDVIKNVAVGNHIEIQKGFVSLIGIVDSEKIFSDEEKKHFEGKKVERILEVSIVGYIVKNRFKGGTKEAPLIGNEAFILSKEKKEIVYNFIGGNELSINIAKSHIDDAPIKLPVDNLFNSHIAVFGNTGSGKSNTVASLYQSLISSLVRKNEKSFKESSKFIIFDFNGEYIGKDCITKNKHSYNLSTHKVEDVDKIPLKTTDMLDVEMFSILSNATEKTQRPFISGVVRFYNRVFKKEKPIDYFKGILKARIKDIFRLRDIKAGLLLDYASEILFDENNFDENNIEGAKSDIIWHCTYKGFYSSDDEKHVLLATDESIEKTKIYKTVNDFKFSNSFIEKIISFMYLQLIQQVLSNRANNEHIAPLINRIKSKKNDIEKADIFLEKNFIVINMRDANLDMKKTIPLLLAKKVYSEHKKNNKGTLTIIIDEAHNILSNQSFRESEDWKDFRLETFEEIIKEGRKFGVFLTIASQRPSDISETIISQAHNYFIHKLVNHEDIEAISNAVSYIDRLSLGSIPTLEVGTCIFSGTAAQLPLKINIVELDEKQKPQSNTIKYRDLIQNNPLKQE